MTTDPKTDLFIPPAAEGLPLAALDSATVGADRLDAAALTPTGRNFLAHALAQLARDGWLRAEPGEGFEPVRDRETPEPAAAPPVSGVVDRATLLREAADELGRMDYDTDSTDYGYDTYRDAWNGGVMDAAEKLRRVAAEEQPAETQDSLPAWLAQRFDPRGADWDGMSDDDRSYWEHQARAVRRAVERGGFKPTAEQPDTQTREADRIVAYVPTARTELHCLRCAPNPAGDIWTPVTAEELDDGGICTACGRDVLIAKEADRG